MNTNLQHLLNSLRPVQLEKIKAALLEAYNEYASEMVEDGKLVIAPGSDTIIEMANIHLAIYMIDERL